MKPPSRLERLLAAVRAHAPTTDDGGCGVPANLAGRVTADAWSNASIRSQPSTWLPGLAWGLVVCAGLAVATLWLPPRRTEAGLLEFDLLAGAVERREQPF